MHNIFISKKKSTCFLKCLVFALRQKKKKNAKKICQVSTVCKKKLKGTVRYIVYIRYDSL